MTAPHEQAKPVPTTPPSPAVIEVCVLGPLEVRLDGIAHPIRSAHGRQLLAHLTYRRPNGARRDEVVDRIWGGAEHAGSPKALQMQVVRLRRYLGNGIIDTTPEGHYRIGRLCTVDADDFVLASGNARAALHSCNHEHATELAQAALRRWRGDPWDELDDDVGVHAERARLLRIRDDMEELLAEARLHDDAMHTLEHLEHLIRLRDYPILRERLLNRLRAPG